MTTKHTLKKRKDRISLVGAFDVDPGNVGKDFGEAVGLGAKTGASVSNDLDKAPSEDIDTLFHTIARSFRKVHP